MSLLFAESFDGIVADARKWHVWSANNSVSTTHGRHGTNGMLVRGDRGTVAQRNFTPGSNRVYVGAWVYSIDQSNDSGHRIVRLVSDAGSEAWVRWGTAAQARFDVGGTGITTQAVGDAGDGQRLQWIFLELMWEPGVAVEVRADTKSLFSATPGSGSGTPNTLSVIQDGVASVTRWRMEDIYVADAAGGVNDTFLGPVKIANIKPDGAGNRTELTPEPSGDNWERVSDGDDDTYVEGDPGDGDLYTFDDLPSSDDVLGVVQHYRAFDSAGGAITGRAITRVDGTEYDGDDKTMPGSVAAHVQPWDVNPDTGQPWTPAEVDGAEFGVEFA